MNKNILVKFIHIIINKKIKLIFKLVFKLINIINNYFFYKTLVFI